ncbi:putative titin [Trypanosoma theileri]|uniref:Putative titin n=1 Tax=Trypanosoma theileri TaxID=67003 RepID=A0A1X0NZ94_9TRYP|nr:putative titin [Trypanosoma theileri]ORC90036.1 putative titin [Trypanosoma theileri]
MHSIEVNTGATISTIPATIGIIIIMMRYVLCILALLLSCACVHVLAEEVPAADLSDQVHDTESETKILNQSTPPAKNCTNGTSEVPECKEAKVTPGLRADGKCPDGSEPSENLKTCPQNQEAPPPLVPEAPKEVVPEKKVPVFPPKKPEVPPAKVPEAPKEVVPSHTRAEEDPLHKTTSQTTSSSHGSEQKATDSEPEVTQPSESESGESHPGRISESTSTTERQGEESTADKQSNEEVSSNTTVNSTPDDSNPNQRSPEAAGAAAAPDSQETNSTSITLPITENTTTEAPTTTPSPVTVPNAEISSIAPIVQKNKANVDSSSVSPVRMRIAAPLLIVVTLACILVC